MTLSLSNFEEKNSGDDQELDVVLEDSVEEETEDEVSQGDSPKEIISPKTEQEEEEKTSTVKDSKDSASTTTESADVNSVDIGSAENNISREEDDITPLKGIKTILVVTTNPDENGRLDIELPENIPEEKVDPEEFVVEDDKIVK